MPYLKEPYKHREKYSKGIAYTANRLWPLVTGVLGPPCSWLIEKTDSLWPYFVGALLVLTVGVLGWDVALYYYGENQGLDLVWITSYPFALYVLFRSTDLPNRIFFLRQSLVNQHILEVYDQDANREASLARERSFDDSSLQKAFLKVAGKRVLPHTAVITILFCTFANYVIHLAGFYRIIPVDTVTMSNWNAFANHILGHIYILLLSLRLGRMVAFGFLMWGHRLVRLSMPNAKGEQTLFSIRLNPQPGHPDGVCGLKKILDFWAFEASLLIPLLVYTLTWLAVGVSKFCSSPYWELCVGQTSKWHHTAEPLNVFFMLSFIMIILQLLSLWWPVLALRVHMGHAQNIVEKQIDEIVRKASALRFVVVNAKEAKVRKESAEQLTEALEAFQDYRNIPLWPISSATLKNHLAQLWTILVFLGIVSQEKTIWPMVKTFLSTFLNTP
jgi:hypothetical protein